jgi:hypothetical protein
MCFNAEIPLPCVGPSPRPPLRPRAGNRSRPAWYLRSRGFNRPAPGPARPVSPAQGPSGSFPQDTPVIHGRAAQRCGSRILFLISMNPGPGPAPRNLSHHRTARTQGHQPMNPATGREQVAIRPPTGTAPRRNPALASPSRLLCRHPTTGVANRPKSTTHQGRQPSLYKPGTSHEQALNRSPRHKHTPLSATLIDTAAPRNMTLSPSDCACASAAPPTTASSQIAPAHFGPSLRTSAEQAANKPPTSLPGTSTPTWPHGFPQSASAGFVCVDRGLSPCPPQQAAEQALNRLSTSTPGTITPSSRPARRRPGNRNCRAACRFGKLSRGVIIIRRHRSAPRHKPLSVCR